MSFTVHSSLINITIAYGFAFLHFYSYNIVYKSLIVASFPKTLTNFPRPEINGAPIDQVANAKSLGVIIDDNLNWSSHIDKLTKKIASGIGAIKRVRHLVPQATLQTSLALLYNRILIIVMLFGETAVSHSNKNCKSYKIKQHAF